jgi:hypothetical protein
MRKLTKIVAPALFAAMAMGAVSPAFAAPMPYRADTIRSQIAELQMRVNRNDSRNHISPREAASLRSDVARLQDQFRAYSRDGLSPVEYRALQGRIDNIRARLQVERHDRDNHRW